MLGLDPPALCDVPALLGTDTGAAPADALAALARGESPGWIRRGACIGNRTIEGDNSFVKTEDILSKLDEAHGKLCGALGRDKTKHMTIYSEAAAEIRKWMALVAEEVGAPE